MASFSQLIEEQASRRTILENHIKAVAAHGTHPLTESQLASHLMRAEVMETKENIPDSDLRTVTKTRLKRLGIHYSEESELSSPIRPRTELQFSVNDENCLRPSARSEARSARLAQLAKTINQWEDDLSHPVIVKPQPVRYDKFGNVLRSSPKKLQFGKASDCNVTCKPKPVRPSADETGTHSTKASKRGASSIEENEVKEASPGKSLNQDSALKGEHSEPPGAPKRVMWDSTVIATLESQGFERCESFQHLVYDYQGNKSPVKCLSPGRSKIVPEKVVNEAISRKFLSEPPAKHVKDRKEDSPPVSSTPRSSQSPSKSKAREENASSMRKQAMLTAALVEELTPKKISSKTDKDPTPRKDNPCENGSPRKNTQVLEMAALYEETSSPTKKVKDTDPSELPLSQRKALFEKNKGGAILPKAPFCLPVPAKVLINSSSQSEIPPPPPPPPPSNNSIIRGETPSGEKLKQIRLEREKEMNQLRSRWDKNKKRGQHQVNFSSPPHHSTQIRSAPCQPAVPDFDDYQDEESTEEMTSPQSSNGSSLTHCPHTGYAMLKEVKKIRISPVKAGHLYPSISDIETETETEGELIDNNNVNSGYERDNSMEESDTSCESLGQEIVKVANMSSSNLKRQNDTYGEEARVLGEIDDFLDEALGDASPPKRSRDSSFESYDKRLIKSDSGSIASDSFEYGQGPSSSEITSTISTTSDCSGTVADQQGTQLVHTISLYRKQKQMTLKTTTVVKRDKSSDQDEEYKNIETRRNPDRAVEISEQEQVGKRIEELTAEISKQQTIISQSSQALNLCSSTIEFSGSAEQTEAERLLLTATQRRLAMSHEVDRLRVEKKLRQGSSRSSERGDLTIHSVSLPLKMDVIRAAAREERCFYCVILVRCGAVVLSSEMLPALPKNLKQMEPFIVTFKKPLTLKQLYSDFMVTLEVYTLETRSKELLPHDIKYHITPSAKKTFVMPTSLLAFKHREKLKMTPKKGAKSDTRLIIGPVESPGGPLAVRSSSFKLSGYSVFSLREINKTNFTLSKISYTNVVEGSVTLKMSCEMTLEGLEYEGFLTMFQDVSGFGAWHRRWCHLKENTISYWLYPEHVMTKVPLDTIDLKDCCTEGDVGLVSRDVCARPNTFLLEVVRPRLPADEDSLVMKTSKHSTLIRHLMSADTKEDRIEWCNRINKCLSLLKAWGKRPSVKQTSM